MVRCICIIFIMIMRMMLQCKCKGKGRVCYCYRVCCWIWSFFMVSFFSIFCSVSWWQQVVCVNMMWQCQCWCLVCEGGYYLWCLLVCFCSCEWYIGSYWLQGLMQCFLGEGVLCLGCFGRRYLEVQILWELWLSCKILVWCLICI